MSGLWFLTCIGSQAHSKFSRMLWISPKERHIVVEFCIPFERLREVPESMGTGLRTAFF